MFKKKLRLAIPVALLLVMSIVATISAAPTTAINLCVTVQDSRPENSTEEISWELRATNAAPTDAPLHSGSGDAIVDATGTVACFEAQGFPGDIYDLWIKGDDTLSVLVENFTYPASSIEPEADLSGSVTLIEGDVQGDDSVINTADLFILVAGANWGTDNDQTDLNESGVTNTADMFRLLAGATNFGQGGTPPVARQAKAAATVPQAVTLDIGEIEAQSGMTVTVPITMTATSETLNGINLDITLDPGLTFVSLTAVAPWIDLTACNGAPVGNVTCRSLGNFAGGSTGTVKVAELTIALPDTANCGTLPIGFAVTDPIDGENGTFVGDSNGALSIPTLETGSARCLGVTSVGMASASTATGATSTHAIALLVATLFLAGATLRAVKID